MYYFIYPVHYYYCSGFFCVFLKKKGEIMKKCIDMKAKKLSNIKTALWGGAAAIIGTASSIIPGWATDSLGNVTTSFKTAAQSIYDNLLIIAPIAAAVIIAVMVLVYIFTTDERDAAAIKKRCIKIALEYDY